MEGVTSSSTITMFWIHVSATFYGYQRIANVRTRGMCPICKGDVTSKEECIKNREGKYAHLKCCKSANMYRCCVAGCETEWFSAEQQEFWPPCLPFVPGDPNYEMCLSCSDSYYNKPSPQGYRNHRRIFSLCRETYEDFMLLIS